VSRLGGGLFESVRHLAKAMHGATQMEVRVLGLEDGKTAEDIEQWAPLAVCAHKVWGPRSLGFSPGLARQLRHEDADLVHLHGLWRFTAVAVRQWAKRTGKAYVVSPHGMLEPWALAQRRHRKRAALWLFQRLSLLDADCIRATSMLEAEGIRRCGFTDRIVVVPNGVHMVGRVPRNRARRVGQNRQALFLSRLHPKKGLVNLVEAWARVRPEGWELTIAGPDEEEHEAEVKMKVRECGIGDRVKFAGEALGEQKARLYEGAELFVLPSFSENFGLVIAEALSWGIPVITTQATPWAELDAYGCGWWIEVGVESLATALADATSLPVEALNQMGERGRALVQKRYGWAKIAQEMASVFEKVIAERAKSKAENGIVVRDVGTHIPKRN